jgi:hypothetical protein
LASTGLWEVISNPLGLVTPDSGTQKATADFQAKLATALALTDTTARDRAVAALANNG